MQSAKVRTYSSKSPIYKYSFFVLSKGLNSGKPLENPTANCFVILCDNEEQQQKFYWLCYGLWQARAFHSYLCGSVIPFLRINDFRKIFAEEAALAIKHEPKHKRMVTNLQRLKELEKTYKHNLQLIADAKRTVYLHYIRNR